MLIGVTLANWVTELLDLFVCLFVNILWRHFRCDLCRGHVGWNDLSCQILWQRKLWCPIFEQTFSSANIKYLPMFKKKLKILRLRQHWEIKWKVIYITIIWAKKVIIISVDSKALRNWKIFLKALSKRLQKLTIKMKRLWRLKFLSFVNVND